MKKTFSIFLLGSLFATAAAQAQTTMPPPRAMPRVPVSHEALMEQRDAMPPSHQLQGPAAIIDGEKLRIGDSDLRLFGIVPPQLAASFGPQARSALDALASGQNVTCQIRDRDRDGRLLATCSNSAGLDMALELLKRGLAVTARGSLAGTELATPYLNAEMAAQNQKIGLWSTVAAASTPVASATPSAAVKQEVATLAAALPAFADSKKEEKPVAAPHVDKVAPETQAKISTADAQAKIADDVVEQHARAQQTQTDQTGWVPVSNDNAGFFERYQILIAGLLMLTTALGITGALWEQKRRDKRDEIKAVAAALRGELMAARGICVGRVKSIASEAEDEAMSWPRIRITLYQAYVGRLGLLGAELARQIASVYGQSSDYASLYNANGTMVEAPKKQALENLVRNIDEILPRLAFIEQAGQLPASQTYAQARPAYNPLPQISHRSTPALRHETPKPAPSGRHEVSSEVKTAEHETTDLSHPLPVDKSHPVSHPVAPPVALWEAVRGFIQNHRNVISEQPHYGSAEHSADPHAIDYAALIEADMARYHYAETIEKLDVTPHKKHG